MKRTGIEREIREIRIRRKEEGRGSVRGGTVKWSVRKGMRRGGK